MAQKWVFRRSNIKLGTFGAKNGYFWPKIVILAQNRHFSAFLDGISPKYRQKSFSIEPGQIFSIFGQNLRLEHLSLIGGGGLFDPLCNKFLGQKY